MPIVIVLLLIIIFILAPWMIIVAAGAAAAYGIYLFIIGAVVVAAIVAFAMKDKIKAILSKQRMSSMIEESNRIARQRQAEDEARRKNSARE